MTTYHVSENSNTYFLYFWKNTFSNVSLIFTTQKSKTPTKYTFWITEKLLFLDVVLFSFYAFWKIYFDIDPQSNITKGRVSPKKYLLN